MLNGHLVERNVGEREHSFTQKRLIRLLDRFEKEFDLSSWPGMRLQVGATRFRVPDVCVYKGSGPPEPWFRTPPFLCIEILSREDRMSRMEEKLGDYFRFGVEYVWVIDPVRGAASIYTKEGSQPVRDGVLRTRNPEIALALDEVVAA